MASDVLSTGIRRETKADMTQPNRPHLNHVVAAIFRNAAIRKKIFATAVQFAVGVIALAGNTDAS